MENVSVSQNVGLSNYSFGHTSTESSAGGTPLYIANNVSYKTRSDLNIYKKFELDFCWNNQPKKKKKKILNHDYWLFESCFCVMCSSVSLLRVFGAPYHGMDSEKLLSIHHTLQIHCIFA